MGGRNVNYDIVKQVRLARALLEHGTSAAELCNGVLRAATMQPHELRFSYYLLKSAAELLTWLQRTRRLVLTPDEGRMCEMVQRFYVALEAAAEGMPRVG
jgi:hypothetical protein